MSETLGGADSFKVPETSESRFETTLSTASLSSALRTACSRTSAPNSVRRRLRVDRSSRRTPSWSSSSAIRRLTVEIGILRRRAASEKLPASMTFANNARELRSAIGSPRLTMNAKIAWLLRELRSTKSGVALPPTFGKLIFDFAD